MHELPTFLSSIPFPQTLLQYGYRFLTAVLAVYVLFCLSPLVMKGKSRYITWLGKNSLGIYTAHLLLMPMIVRLVSIFEVELSVTILISFLVALALSSAIVFILKKNRMFARILLGHI